MVSRLVEAELSRYDWAQLYTCGGTAEQVPAAVRGMLESVSGDEVDRYYWRLENRVVVQQALYSSAPAVIGALLAGLADDIAFPARVGALELLYQIASGESGPEAVVEGKPNLGHECRTLVRKGLWIIYRQLFIGPGDAASDLLEVIETDVDRLEKMREIAKFKKR
ncbi:hypothetical protein Acor_71530 [Acrocarpospora corrugata]|uniref:HEAT repeat domain-containing protein n=1 Tax=Acrocarpospora corrugata TaxID=35763 RepID=A0A5M3W7Q7_9ACTN|nr:hypothetical protein [Acrocarpospora corrugata]GES05085.1 hypothetical protein Acor_71530 [Acrocarpospora corrugata]